jgi:hypothetical protein
MRMAVKLPLCTLNAFTLSGRCPFHSGKDAGFLACIICCVDE